MDFYGFHIYLAVHNFAENLVRLARCVAKIQLLLCPVDRKHTVHRQNNKFVRVIRIDNICPYTRVMSVIRVVYNTSVSLVSRRYSYIQGYGKYSNKFMAVLSPPLRLRIRVISSADDIL